MGRRITDNRTVRDYTAWARLLSAESRNNSSTSLVCSVPFSKDVTGVSAGREVCRYSAGTLAPLKPGDDVRFASCIAVYGLAGQVLARTFE